jgi:hypothetical protein
VPVGSDKRQKTNGSKPLKKKSLKKKSLKKIKPLAGTNTQATTKIAMTAATTSSSSLAAAAVAAVTTTTEITTTTTTALTPATNKTKKKKTKKKSTKKAIGTNATTLKQPVTAEITPQHEQAGDVLRDNKDEVQEKVNKTEQSTQVNKTEQTTQVNTEGMNMSKKEKKKKLGIINSKVSFSTFQTFIMHMHNPSYLCTFRSRSWLKEKISVLH